MAANLVLPYTHTATQPQDASQFMANLRAIITWMNLNAQLLDGSKAMTGQLVGPASDPTTTAQYMRKSYADALVTTEASARATGDLAGVRFGCKVQGDGTQTFNTGAATACSFTSETYDTNAFFSPTSTNVTVPSGGAGVYVIQGIITPSSLNTNGFVITINVNGAVVATGGGATNNAEKSICSAVFTTVQLAVGDVVTLIGTQSNGFGVFATGTLVLQRLGDV